MSVNEDKNIGDAVGDQETGEIVETPIDAFRRSAGFQFMFVLHSGLAIGKAIDHLCASAEKFSAAMREWQPIETAPQDGRSFLVGRAGSEWVDRACFMDAHLLIVGGKWEPTHWMPLPDPPCLSINNEKRPGQASKSKSV